MVGLATALFLSHQKIPVTVLERHLGSSLHPRAIGYTARTIETLRSVGVDTGIPGVSWASGPPRRVVVESLAGKWQEEKHWTPHGPKPTEDNPASPKKGVENYSPVTGLAVAQDRIEPVLRQSAVEHGADLRLGCKVTSWSQDDDGVQVQALDNNDNTFTIKGKYLIACDGARSDIREKLGIQRQGVGHIQSLRSILFRCPPIQKYLERGYVQFQIEGRDDGFEAFLCSYGDGRWALMWNENGQGKAPREPMPENVQRAWIRKAVGTDVPDGDIEVITTGEWDLAGLIADTFSSGRVFLAGDAAHTLPPNRGGYGANTGFGDAHNLAWKMASVLNGTARPGLLDTYDAERRPVAQVRHDQIFARQDYRRFVADREWPGKDCNIYDDVAMELGQLYRSDAIIIGAAEDLPPARCPDEWNGQPGTRAPHIVLRRRDENISSLDLFCEGWVLLSRSDLWRPLLVEAAKECGVPCDFVEIGGEIKQVNDGEFEENFGVHGSGAVLVRPDGYVAWRAASMSATAGEMLRQALRQVSYAK